MAGRTIRQKNFDPGDYQEKVYDLARTNPALLAKTVTQVARKKNQNDGHLDKADAGTIELVSFVTLVGVTSGMMWWDGRLKAKRDATLAAWQAGGHAVGEGCPKPWEVAGKSDPETLIGPVPKVALVPAGSLLLWAVARIGRAGKKSAAGMFETAMYRTSLTTFAVLVASLAQTKGYCGAEHEIVTGQTTINVAA